MFACYLLRSLSEQPGSKGRTYVGFTVNPLRRLRQHNGELKAGGALQTRRHRPWQMLLLVHGFRSHVLALQFEWAWQHPSRSRALQQEESSSHSAASSCAHGVRSRLVTLGRLLHSRRWASTPLTLTFLEEGGVLLEHDSLLDVPRHVGVDIVPLEELLATTTTAGALDADEEGLECGGCGESARNNPAAAWWQCASCGSHSHLTCCALAATRSTGMLLPTSIACASCEENCDWLTAVRTVVIPEKSRNGADTVPAEGDRSARATVQHRREVCK